MTAAYVQHGGGLGQLVTYVFHYFVARGLWTLLYTHGIPVGLLLLVGLVGSVVVARARRRGRH